MCVCVCVCVCICTFVCVRVSMYIYQCMSIYSCWPSGPILRLTKS